MQDTEFYERLLGLSKPWKVTDVAMDMAAGEVRVKVACDATVWVGDGGVRLHVHGYEQRRWRHLDTCQFRTIIEASVPRVLDPANGKTQMVKVPWAGPRSGWTLMFEHFVVRVLLACGTLSDALHLTGLDWHQAQGIMSRAVERGLKRRKLEQIDFVGLDEKSFRRGQDYISVMTDLVAQRVLEVQPGRDTVAVLKLWDLLPEDTRQQVQAAAMDFGAAYAAATRQAVPQALIVYDKFHVSQMLSKAVDTVRRQEHKILMGQGDETLKGSRYVWLRGLEKMSDEEFLNFQQLVELSLKTSRAWEHKELFAAFWEQRTAAEGARFFARWLKRVMSSRLEPVKKAARTLKTHIQGLLNYFTHPITNALTEGLNSRIQLLKASARGFRNFENYRIRILFFLGGLDMLPALSKSHGN